MSASVMVLSTTTSASGFLTFVGGFVYGEEFHTMA